MPFYDTIVVIDDERREVNGENFVRAITKDMQEFGIKTDRKDVQEQFDRLLKGEDVSGHIVGSFLIKYKPQRI